MRYVLAAVVGAGLVAGPAWADDQDAVGKKLMGAAAVVLSTVAYNPVGSIDIESADYARFTDGNVQFKKLSDCRYTTFGTKGQSVLFAEIVDFRALTGRYEMHEGIGGLTLTMDGRSPKTRCFLLEGNTGCLPYVSMSALPIEQVRRVVDDVNYIQRTACHPTPPDPY